MCTYSPTRSLVHPLVHLLPFSVCLFLPLFPFPQCSLSRGCSQPPGSFARPLSEFVRFPVGCRWSLVDSPAVVSKMARSASASAPPFPGKHRHPCIIPRRCRAVRGHVRARAFTSNVPYLYKGEPTLCVYLCRRACKPTDQPGYRSRTRRIMRRARWLKRAANLSPE